MNGLIPKRSCVNPVLITTFGLEPLGTKRDEGEGAVARERSDRKGIGETIPQSNRRCPKPGSNRHVFLRTLDFESNASTNSAIRANGLRKNASNRLDFAKILQKAELSKCGKFK